MSGVRKRIWASGLATWEASWFDASGRRHTANYDTRSEAEVARALLPQNSAFTPINPRSASPPRC